jgi:hypothetical protein
VVRRGARGLLHRQGQWRTEAGLNLFRRGAGAAISGQVAHPRLGAAHRGQHGQAAGAGAQDLMHGSMRLPVHSGFI